MYLAAIILLLVHNLGAVLAAPFHVVRRATPVSGAEVDTFAPYTQFSRASYCNIDKVRSWTCGQACAGVPGFQPTLVGRTHVSTYIVGYWPQENAVVVAREGTDPLNFLALLTDLNLHQRPLDPTIFPGAPSGVTVHDGFADEQAETAPAILAEVQRLLNAKGTRKIRLAGHSMGGAIVALEALSFKLRIPNVEIKAITYGTPRIGNPAFAQFFDSKITDYRRVNNDNDIVPILPPRSLGFLQTQGETHILDNGRDIVACSGNDNDEDPQCQIKTVPNILVGNILDHLGPYDGIYIGTIFCN